MAEGIFIHSHNEVSDRFSILDETDEVAFFYITKKGTQEPEKDAIAYMRVTPEDNVDWKEMAESGRPPVLSSELASPNAVLLNANEGLFGFEWSADGNSVALHYNNEPIALVSAQKEIGYSKAVAKDNSLTNAWSQALYNGLFNR
ncbi:hypothetical protein AYI85_04945 [Shewanella algae]|uniref:hypothetical protein n=1 Tax=Shewanella algae TaxID=38313 RepID=UPI000D12CA6E|nr:hypothetical protein [Shewanella algae]PSS71688.1 hypothetical protein AYI85_04945 [Shewanella algae]